MEGEAASAWVVSARGIDQEHIGQPREGAHGGLQQGALTQREQSWLVGRARAACDYDCLAADAGGRPRRVAGMPGAALAAGEADEDSADPRARLKEPWRRLERAQPLLLLDQLLARARPGWHTRILARLKLALTFDDGPGPVTPPLLDLLAGHGARATFFVLGRMVEGREETLRRTVAKGHEVGNHTWSHHRPRGLSDDELRDELARTSARIEEVAGIRPRLARPPYGGDEERFARVAAGLGLHTVLWTVNPRDWLEPPADWLARAILRYARPGAIVDLHDGFTPRRPDAPRQAMVGALRLVLPQLTERGFRLVTVSELTDPLVAAAREAGVQDERVLAAIAAVPRAEFVPAERAESADIDTPIPIPHKQVTTQPSLVARMVEALALEGDERVLEIGTGYGWQTALLARLAREVFSVERFADLAETARAALAGYGNVTIVVGDGSEGLREHAPFDGILVAAAYPTVPDPLAEQLAEGGRLVQPLGPGGAEDVVLFEKRGGELRRVRSVSGAHFVRLHGRHAFP
jgi:protein-L-isoaspartate(D-aspartate) O-methyltransferase